MADRLSDYLRSLPPRAFAATEEAFAELVVGAHASIKEGSGLTGAPGQPVDIGQLRNAWLFEFETPLRARIVVTGDAANYAGVIEDAVGKYGPITLRSAVGGFHSIKLTVAGLQKIADDVARRRRKP